MKKMKANGPSLSSMKSSLYDSIREFPELKILRMNGDLNITGFVESGERLKSIKLQILAIKCLARQRKEAIPKGKIHSFFNFATLIRIWSIQSEMEIIEESIERITESYMNLGSRLETELISDINRCLLQEEANNKISPEMFQAIVLSPTLTMEIGVNNQLQNEPESLKCESQTGNSGYGKTGTKVTEDGEARA